MTGMRVVSVFFERLSGFDIYAHLRQLAPTVFGFRGVDFWSTSCCSCE